MANDLQLKGSSIEFLTSGGLNIRHFEFYVADETAVEVQRLMLQEVKIFYNVAVAEGDGDDIEVSADDSLTNDTAAAANEDVSTNTKGDIDY